MSRTIKKGDTVTMKNGRTYKVIRIDSHINLQRIEHTHMPPVASGFTAWKIRGESGFWNQLQEIH